jgi:hypothetical protein
MSRKRPEVNTNILDAVRKHTWTRPDGLALLDEDGSGKRRIAAPQSPDESCINSNLWPWLSSFDAGDGCRVEQLGSNERTKWEAQLARRDDVVTGEEAIGGHGHLTDIYASVELELVSPEGEAWAAPIDK